MFQEYNFNQYTRSCRNHCTGQGFWETYIKQNISSIDFFRSPVVTQFMVKVKRKIEKVPFLKVYHFSISQHFPNVKVVIVQAVIAYKLAPNR